MRIRELITLGLVLLLPIGASAQAKKTAPVAKKPAPAAPKVASARWTITGGTIAPGMHRAQVVSVFGEPAAMRTAGTRSFLFYHNGCERKCGTYDVVLLDADSVTDAILRAPARHYSGTTSSPAGAPHSATNVTNVSLSEAANPSAPAQASPARTGSVALPSIINNGSNGSASAPAENRSSAPNAPAQSNQTNPNAKPDSITSRTLPKGAALPPQPPRTIFPTKP